MEPKPVLLPLLPLILFPFFYIFISQFDLAIFDCATNESNFSLKQSYALCVDDKKLCNINKVYFM